MTDEPLHPEQSSAKGEHDDGNIRPATQAEIQQDHNGQPHHGDEPCTGLKFTVDLYVHALTQKEGDRGAVVGAKVPFEVHVRPLCGATGPFGLAFQAFLFGVLWRVENKFTIGQTVAANSETFVTESDFLFLMGVFPNDLPTHFFKLGAVELNQQPRGRTRPATLAPQGTFPRSVGK